MGAAYRIRAVRQCAFQRDLRRWNLADIFYSIIAPGWRRQCVRGGRRMRKASAAMTRLMRAGIW